MRKLKEDMQEGGREGEEEGGEGKRGSKGWRGSERGRQ